MKPGFTVPELSQTITWECRIDSKRGRQVLAVGLPVLEASLSVDGTAQVPERLTAKFPHTLLPATPLSPLAAYGQRLVVSVELTLGGTVMQYDMGEYVVQSWAEQSDGTVTVEAAGVLQVVADAPWPAPTSPAPNSTLLAELRRIVHPLSARLDSQVENSALPRGLAWGNDRLDALYDLASASGGRVVSRPGGTVWIVPNRSGVETVRSYSGRDLAVEMLKRGDHQRANEVTVVHQARDDAGSAVWRTEANHRFPFDPDGYGVVRRVVDSAATASPVTLARLAAKKLGDEAMRTDVRQLEIVADPAIELWDIIGLHLNNQTLVGRVQAFEMPLTAGDVMRVDVEELRF